MKRLLYLVCVLMCVFRGYAEPVSADDILAFVRSSLPGDPVRLTGSLKVKTKTGFTKPALPVVMELDWGASTPTADYTIGTESLTITWHNDNPAYTFSNGENTPASDILDSGITWADLSFSVLWWSGSKLIDEGKKLNRDCYIVDVPVPDSTKTMRLWIEKSMGMLLEARTLDPSGKELSRLRIDSIKKMEGMWVAKDLIFDDKTTGTKTTLRISELEWKSSGDTAEEQKEVIP